MQRLGYLKHVVRRVVAVETSSLDNLGTDLIQTVMRKERVPLTDERVSYIQRRLYDPAYDTIKKEAALWHVGEERTVAMELQDLYLADASLPSQTGKLTREDWRKYPPLGVALGLIRAGTYSANTRAFSLLHLTPEREFQAFLQYLPDANPFRLTRTQGLLLLYTLLENDGEVMAPLLSQLAGSAASGFTDRDVGDRLPKIYRDLVKRHRGRGLPPEQRDRLQVLSKAAHSIEKWRERRYTGGGANVETSRPRVEPYVDIGLLHKADPYRYSYALTQAGVVWAEAFTGVETDAEISTLLGNHFFATAATAWEVPAMPIGDRDSIVRHSHRAWQATRSAGGYAPIEEIALVAGIHALCDDGLILEPKMVWDAVISYQKDHPYQVRFTVNRMGVLAHARFVNDPG
jgi:hypothetical protein